VKELKLNIFERKISRRIYYGPCINTRTRVWRKSHNEELNELFQRLNIIKEISKKRMNWGGHAWRNQGSLFISKKEKLGHNYITIHGCL